MALAPSWTCGFRLASAGCFDPMGCLHFPCSTWRPRRYVGLATKAASLQSGTLDNRLGARASAGGWLKKELSLTSSPAWFLLRMPSCTWLLQVCLADSKSGSACLYSSVSASGLHREKSKISLTVHGDNVGALTLLLKVMPQLHLVLICVDGFSWKPFRLF